MAQNTVNEQITEATELIRRLFSKSSRRWELEVEKLKRELKSRSSEAELLTKELSTCKIELLDATNRNEQILQEKHVLTDENQRLKESVQILKTNIMRLKKSFSRSFIDNEFGGNTILHHDSKASSASCSPKSTYPDQPTKDLIEKSLNNFKNGSADRVQEHHLFDDSSAQYFTHSMANAESLVNEIDSACSHGAIQSDNPETCENLARDIFNEARLCLSDSKFDEFMALVQSMGNEKHFIPSVNIISSAKEIVGDGVLLSKLDRLIQTIRN
eukprot:1001619_1